MTELHLLTIAEAARLIRLRKLSPLEYARALVARIEAFNGQLNAFITHTPGKALEEAARAEREITSGDYRGPLHGIPFALKDIYNTKGVLTSGGSRIGLGHIPAADATAARKLRKAGGVLMGKLQTHELAHGGPSFDLPWPPARNPWHLEHFTGGSSSGSAAAVAADMVPGTLGSDTGGSIRGPASYCGITGYMPTYGLVSRFGVIPNSFTFDHCGPMARTVEDCAILLQGIAGHDPADAGSIEQPVPDYRAALQGGIRGLKIGVLRHYWEEELPVQEEHRRSMEDAVATFKSLGAIVEDCRASPVAEGMDIKIVIAETEIFAIHQHELSVRAEAFGRDFLARVLPACLFQAADYVQALREHRRYIANTKPLFEKFDVLLTCGFGPAPRLDAHRSINFWKRSTAHTPWNTARCAALALPCGFSSNRLPLGMQIIGPAFQDAKVLRAGHAYQLHTDWHMQRPVLEPGLAAPHVDWSANRPAWAPDESTRTTAEQSARRAGLRLGEREMAILLECAPHALAMAERIRRPRDWSEQPSLVHSFTR